MNIKNNIGNYAAILCIHVANRESPILRAVRDEPVDPDDSGWQFHCNSRDVEKESEAKIWSVNEVIELEPTLSPFINLPPGTKLTRSSKDSKWIKEA
jgi:hypothetical protein